MNIIHEADMTLEKLLSVFLSRNVAAEIIGSYTGDSSPFLKVIYPDMLPIIIWINQHVNCRAQLQMAATILTRNEKKLCKESRLQNMVSNLNGPGNFGAIYTESIHGVRVNGMLLFQDGILEQTVLLSADYFANKATRIRETLLSLQKS